MIFQQINVSLQSENHCSRDVNALKKKIMQVRPEVWMWKNRNYGIIRIVKHNACSYVRLILLLSSVYYCLYIVGHKSHCSVDWFHYSLENRCNFSCLIQLNTILLQFDWYHIFVFHIHTSRHTYIIFLFLFPDYFTIVLLISESLVVISLVL